MSVKDFDYYVQNPDELPSDPAAIEALVSGQQSEAVTEPEEEQQQEAATAEQDEKTQEPSEPEQAEAEVPAPVLSRDGKHTIPYGVLQSEREKRVAAERAQQELLDRIAEIEAKLSSGNLGGQVSEEVKEILSEESVTAMVEDFPQMKPLIEYTRQMEAQLKTFQDRFAEMDQIEQARMQAEMAKRQAEVRKEIEANPTLSYWESIDQEKWQAALEADQQLRGLLVNQNLTLAERFNKVVAVVEAIYGPTELPPEFAPPKAPPKDLSAKVKKAVESAETFKPKTLGEMPGGMASANDDGDLSEMAPARLAAMMDKMSPAQISELLAKAG